ncbi:MAG: hypothetical protein KatS3mg058_3915 [Roseiflexus sp.]|nr:MAG: hypothetical protein KatS3mg058_3915 [Roseiflexus sp.]
MSVATTETPRAIVYPESDGQPMADNTLQFRWIVMLQGNLAALFADRPDVFVAGDLLWYPVEGRPDIRRAPDVLVAIGRPKGDRGAYLQWEEGNQPPQAVFEVLSPGNTLREMAHKFEFYNRYGVQEYYLIDPERGDVSGWVRQDGVLTVIDDIDGWVSPLLGVRFAVRDGAIRLFYPDGRPFLTFEELAQARAAAEERAQREAEARAAAEGTRATGSRGARRRGARATGSRSARRRRGARRAAGGAAARARN